MAQFIVAAAECDLQARESLAHAVQAAQALFELSPYDQQQFGNIGVATFARHIVADESGKLTSRKELDAWCLGVGTWVDQRGLAPEQQSRRLASSHPQLHKLQHELSAIDGCFSFVTGSMENGMLRVITDPLGRMHVYRLALPGVTLLSTSALLLAHISDAQWDPLGIREFLARGIVYEGRSLFLDVEKLPAATILTFSGNKQQHQFTYWSLRDHIEQTPTPAESLEAFAEALHDSTRNIIRQFERPVLDLTGGYDSRILLAAARTVTPERLPHTVVAGDADHPDVTVAGNIAHQMALQHAHLHTSHDTAAAWWQLARESVVLVDGECNILEYANILRVHRHLAERFGISINGSGGEIIRGYWWELLFPRIGARDAFDSRHVARHRYATDPWAEPHLAYLYAEPLIEHFAGVIERTNLGLEGSRNTACMDNVYLNLRMQHWQGRIASASNRLWPCLSPLLFRRPMEIGLGAAISLRRNGRMARRLLAIVDYELARLPMAGGYPALPITLKTLPQFRPLGAEYLQRVRQRLMRTNGPVSGAVQQQQAQLTALLRLEEVADLLNPKHMLSANLYEPGSLQQLITSFMQGQSSIAHCGRVMTLEATAQLRQAARRLQRDSLQEVMG